MALLSRQYTCVAYLTTAGVDLVGVSADDRRDLITDASAYVEALTDQIFNPMAETRTWDGRGSAIVYDPQLLRILDVTSVTLDYDRTNYRNEPIPNTVFESIEGQQEEIAYLGVLGSRALSATEYRVYDRWIETIINRFPGGTENVEVAGVFGWLDPARAEVTTAIDDGAGLVTDATTVTVDSTAGFEEGDLVLIGANLYVIVTEVTDATTLTFDSVGTIVAGAFPDDTAVRTWGKVPRPITNLTNFIAHQFREEDVARADAQRFVDVARLRKEQTDRYMYELFSPDLTAGGSLTGSIRHDMVVKRYSRPAVAVPI